MYISWRFLYIDTHEQCKLLLFRLQYRVCCEFHAVTQLLCQTEFPSKPANKALNYPVSTVMSHEVVTVTDTCHNQQRRQAAPTPDSFYDLRDGLFFLSLSFFVCLRYRRAGHPCYCCHGSVSCPIAPLYIKIPYIHKALRDQTYRI
jgi:hypothetical protein